MSSNSLMVILDQEEYCFLYDDPSFPELLESLLSYQTTPQAVGMTGLDCDQAREIATDLLGDVHQNL